MTAAAAAVRSARPDDLPGILRLEQLCFDDPWPPLLLHEELVRDARRRPLVVEDDGALAGFLMAWVVVDEYHVVNLAVDPGRRRRGLAARLLAAGLDEAVGDGCVSATLEVRASNAGAIAFYGAHGFVQVGRRPRYYADNGEDALILTVELTQG
ncbi:MAG TPA: ribosomal protein S18-alanine N-acetyltransferase [Candidatus Krumholzibacteria bacterium]|nr:ribosomal protein S18-alanine N-acetyltransferase [Candidatus Krumholzibacteria bacterium]HRX51560.1 ribosomal protein S18-alanine N-acetyltransferase [Candidatus Krumholzibacteria bacterium]